MGYESRVSGTVVPAKGKFQELLTLLKTRGFTLSDVHSASILVGEENRYTGLEVMDETLVGEDESFSVYGFNKQLITVFSDAVDQGLILSLDLSRTGEDNGDREHYELEDGTLYQQIEFITLVPYGQRAAARRRFELIKGVLGECV